MLSLEAIDRIDFDQKRNLAAGVRRLRIKDMGAPKGKLNSCARAGLSCEAPARRGQAVRSPKPEDRT
jgi:hypothetical protein